MNQEVTAEFITKDSNEELIQVDFDELDSLGVCDTEEEITYTSYGGKG